MKQVAKTAMIAAAKRRFQRTTWRYIPEDGAIKTLNLMN
jgi:hypothetical protein